MEQRDFLKKETIETPEEEMDVRLFWRKTLL